MEVDRYLDHLAGRDLDEDRPVHPLRPATLKLRDHELRTLTSALVRQGLPAENLTSLSVCLSLENYKSGLSWLYRRYGGKPGTTIHNMAANLRSVARYWLKADEQTLQAMARIVRHVAPPDQGMSDKNRERLRPFESDAVLRKLVNLPQIIRRHIESAKPPTARKTGLSTAALAIELLLVAPLRISNLAALHLDRHIVKAGDKTYLVIPKKEVKNTKDLEFELPQETVAFIEWFIANHRKGQTGNRYLFAGEGMGPKSNGTLATQIVGAVKTYMGLTVHPHLFRSIAATIHFRAHPGDYETARLVLGHRNLSTTTKAYASQEEKVARRHFVNTVLELKEQQRAPSRSMRNQEPVRVKRCGDRSNPAVASMAPRKPFNIKVKP